MFADLLGRTAASSEVSNYNAVAAASGWGTVAHDIVFSSEHFARVVDGWYLKLLGRHADAGGMRLWVGFLQSGATEEQVISAVYRSDEYRARAPAAGGGPA